MFPSPSFASCLRASDVDSHDRGHCLIRTIINRLSCTADPFSNRLVTLTCHFCSCKLKSFNLNEAQWSSMKLNEAKWSYCSLFQFAKAVSPLCHSIVCIHCPTINHHPNEPLDTFAKGSLGFNEGFVYSFHRDDQAFISWANNLPTSSLSKFSLKPILPSPIKLWKVTLSVFGRFRILRSQGTRSGALAMIAKAKSLKWSLAPKENEKTWTDSESASWLLDADSESWTVFSTFTRSHFRRIQTVSGLW